jgi:hypothetical protein
MRRRTVLIIVAALTLIAIIAGYLALHGSLRPPANEPDRYAAFVELTLSQQPAEGENAWSDYHSHLYGSATTIPALDSLSDSSQSLLLSAWGDPRHDSAKARLPEIRAAVAPLDGVLGKPRCVLFDPEEPSPGVGSLEVFAMLNDEWSELLSAMRDVSRLNRVLMRDDASRGDWPEVVRRLRLGRAIAGHSAMLPVILFRLNAGSLDLAAIESAAICAHEYGAPLEVIDALIEAASAPPGFDDTGLVALRGEELAILDTMQGIYNGQQPPWSLLRLCSYREVKSNIERYFDDAEAWWTSPVTTRGPAPGGNQPASGGFIRRIDPGEVFLPSLRAGDAVASVATSRGAAVLSLQIERFEREHGRLPVTLDELPDQSITREPFSGDRFQYAINESGSPGYMLVAPESANHVHPNWRDMTLKRDEIPVARNPVTGEPID